MQKLQFSTGINASKEKIWNILWDDKTFRDWANNIDDGMYMTGDLKEGNEVQFRSPTGYGVRSKVLKLTLNELVIFQHLVDTLDDKEREKEWTGGTESYALIEKEGVTSLSIDLDVPPGQEENFTTRLPKALKRVKELAEK